MASVAIGLALWHLHAATAGLTVQASSVDGTPATIFRSASAQPGPVVVIAHGFAGSQHLMQPFATTLAHNGYVAVTFDFPGHGLNAGARRGVRSATAVLSDHHRPGDPPLFRRLWDDQCLGLSAHRPSPDCRPRKRRRFCGRHHLSTARGMMPAPRQPARADRELPAIARFKGRDRQDLPRPPPQRSAATLLRRIDPEPDRPDRAWVSTPNPCRSPP